MKVKMLRYFANPSLGGMHLCSSGHVPRSVLEIAIRERWKFCPHCGAALAWIDEVEYEGNTHLYGTNSDRSKHVPAWGEVFRTDCGRYIRIDSLTPVDENRIIPQDTCPECVMQNPKGSREYEYVLRGITSVEYPGVLSVK